MDSKNSNKNGATQNAISHFKKDYKEVMDFHSVTIDTYDALINLKAESIYKEYMASILNMNEQEVECLKLGIEKGEACIGALENVEDFSTTKAREEATDLINQINEVLDKCRYLIGEIEYADQEIEQTFKEKDKEYFILEESEIGQNRRKAVNMMRGELAKLDVLWDTKGRALCERKADPEADSERK